MTEETTKKKPNWLVWLFAAFGLAGVAAVIFIAIMIANIGGGGREERAPLAVADGETKYSMGQVIDLRGNDLSALTIISGDRNAGCGSFSSKSYRENITHNLIFFDRNTRKSRKLLNDNRGKVIAAVFLPDQETGFPLAIGDGMNDATNVAEAAAQAAMEAAGIVGAEERDQFKRRMPLKNYMAIVALQDGETMKNSLLLGRLSDGKQVMTLDGVETVRRFWILSPTEVGMIVQRNGEIFHHIANFESLSITQSTKIEVN
ncbi:hypothetical protein [Sphingorhabdus sp. YGSMI21]|uniref:hypothetical protein n=1 Tax=Sphingorhabdus sp. YGSMI21 TaxID=2077182 RepID=UPI000C1E2DBF|nr:hypothetical protein [Sphingorhabdus sp. YGSMI21]ATW04532.1 hypothetical protein CHN51_14060 [Sphingorhabdus sp. YGSMI21]